MIFRNLALIMLLLQAISSLTVVQTDDSRESCGLLGPVRSVRIEETFVPSDESLSGKSDRTLAQLDTYDREGNLIESVHYDPDGSVSWVWTIKYDNDGKKIEERACEVSNSSCTRYLFTFSRDSRRSRVQEIDQDGNLIGWSVNTYNANGVEVKNSRYNTAGRMIYRNIYSFDHTGKKKRRVEVSYDLAAAPSHAPGMWVYSYDSVGKLTEARSYESPHGESLLSRVEYYYDGRGNLKQELIYKGKGNLAERIAYSSYEYDSYSNWVKRLKLRETTTNGKLVVQSYTSTNRYIRYY